jgi:hypothetical protein
LAPSPILEQPASALSASTAQRCLILILCGGRACTNETSANRRRRRALVWRPLRACTIRVGLAVPVCYPEVVRFALRGCAVLAIALGMAVVAPVQRIEQSRDARSGITPAGERGDAPAIRSGLDRGRRLAHPVPVALLPATAVLRGPSLVGPVRPARRADWILCVRAGACRARAPPPSA